MIKLISRALNNLKDPSRSFKERVFILLTFVTYLVGILALIGDIVTGENTVEIVTLTVMVFAVPFVTFVSLKLNKLQIAIWGIVLGLDFVLIPILFYYGGGVEGGGVLWIIFAYLYTGLVMSGIWRPLMLIVLTFETMGFYLHGYFHPEYIRQHSRAMFYVDSMISIILVGIVSCLMVWFEEWLFKKENERAKEETKKIEEMNRSQNRFFSSMSHELRTPINSILGLNEIILRQEDASEEIIRDSNNIQGAGRMLLALINDILDFSKIEAGKMDIVPVNYSIAELLSEIVNMMWLRTEQKGLEFRIEVDPSIPSELFGDEVRIKQILTNLLNNAVKYTSEGSVTLRIDREESKEDQILLMFSVIDTGIGIKQDAIPYLFDAFRRVDEEQTGKIEGTGLGLSIVKQLVDLMGGRITVNSVYTQESTFTVALWQKVTRPDAVGDIDLSGYGSAMATGAYQASFTAPDANILIVDDNLMNLEVEKKLLEDTGMNIDTARSGEEALVKTFSVRYDLILMDHLMPEMDGIECLQHIRMQSGGLNNHVPVIVLTANALGENRELYSTSGFDGYLVKPVSGLLLEETVLSHLPESKIRKNEGSEAAKFQMMHAGTYSRKIPVLIAAGSVCDLPAGVIKTHQLEVLPYSIISENCVYYDSSEAGTDELMRYVKQGHRYESDPPTVEEFEQFFGMGLKKAHDIIYITVSSSINSEYERAMEAARAYGNVHIYDSGLSSGCIGLLALLAQRMCTQGRGPDRIIEELNMAVKRLNYSFMADMTYFVKNRDLIEKSNFNAFARILNIHPFVRIKNGRYRIGRVAMIEQTRCMEKYIDYALPKLKKPDPDILIVIYVGLSDNEKELIEARIRRRFEFKNIIFQKASGVIALNIGTGSFGLVYFEEGSHSYNLSPMFMSYDEYEDAKDQTGYESGRPAETYHLSHIGEQPSFGTGTKQPEYKWYDGIEGIDPVTAISHSGSEELFRSVLKIFYESIDSNKEEIDSFFNTGDWDNYVIKVHALKSSSRLIGAERLADKAQALEAAGKNRDLDYIRANHDGVMEEYRSYRSLLEPVFADDPEVSGLDDSEEIFEFDPE